MDLENVGSTLHHACSLVRSLLNVVLYPCSQFTDTGTSGRFVLAEGTRGMDSCSGVEAFCRGEEYGLLRAKKSEIRRG